jgi:hypothetical protein
MSTSDFENAGEDLAAGTESADDSDLLSSAETLNTDSEDGEDPGPIPYARFKEVNDQYKELKPFAELTEYGYDADSLRQLAEFDARFQSDPVGMWLSVGDQLDLPDTVKAAIQAEATGGRSPAKPQGGPDVPDEPLDRVAQLEKRLDEKEAAETQAQWNQTLDELMTKWRKADKADELTESPPDEVMLTYIEKHAQGAKDLDDIVVRARGAHTEYLDKLMGGAIKKGGRKKAPVPSGGSPPANQPEAPKTLAEASRLARIELEAASQRENQ